AVPVTALKAATSRAATSVNLSAEAASAFVISSQNVPSPCARELQMSAASGTSTIKLRLPSAMPRARPPPARPRTAAGRETATAELAANYLHHDPAVVIEEAELNRLPAAQTESLGIDLEERPRLLEPVLRAPGDRLDDGPVAGVAEELLRLRGPEEL